MSELPLNQILCGNCVEVLKDFPENSIDLVVTDPPYGLKFMGKDWDKALPSREAFTEIIRVLKPGALAFVMSSPRQDLLWRMLALLEGVGFELTQSYIDWIYKTGFPKAYDVSKGIDKKFGRLNQSVVEIKLKLIKIFDDSGKTRSKIDEECGFRACNYLSLPKEGKRFDPWVNILPSYEKWLKIKEVVSYDGDEITSLLDIWFEEANREIIGNKTKLNSFKNGYGVGFTNYNKVDIDITIPFSELAQNWDGWKSQTGLKPAHEPILMVNKPFSESTIVDNVLKWGTGAINVDVCRIPFQTQEDSELVEAKHDSVVGLATPRANTYNWKEFNGERTDGFTPKGRFPANLLVSDKALDTGELTKSGDIKEGSYKNGKKHLRGNIYGGGVKEYKSDSGDQSRYFDLDAWAEHHGFLDVPKPDNKERDYGLKGRKAIPKSKFHLNDGSKDERFDGLVSLPRRNTHPTVKPVKLMAYLIELGCPPGGVVLDPFVGSGTTCIAAKKLVRKYVGIEIKPEYVALAQARIRAYPIPFDWLKEGSMA